MASPNRIGAVLQGRARGASSAALPVSTRQHAWSTSAVSSHSTPAARTAASAWRATGASVLGPEVVERRRRRRERRSLLVVVREERVFLLLREFQVGELVGERDRLGVGEFFGCCGLELF